MRTIPVSRASFHLTDRDASERAISLAVSWMERTAGAELPSAAYLGESFEFSGKGAKASVSALKLNDIQGSIWAARLNYHADTTENRNWITDLFIERHTGAFTRFGAQLTCHCSLDDPGFEHSRPRVVRDIIENLSAEADNENLANEFQDFGLSDLNSFVDLLYNPLRRLPVILVSVDDIGGAQVNLSKLATRLSGAAHLRSISVEPSFELSRLVGKRMSAFDGAIRAYMPGLEKESEDPFRHPLWLAPPSGWNPRLVGQVAARILPLGFRDSDGDTRFWRIGLLRQSLSRAAANEAEGTEADRLRAEIEALEAEGAALREAAQTAEDLMYEEGQKLADQQASVGRLEEENFSLRQRIRSFDKAEKNIDLDVEPDDIYSIFEQNPTLETSLRIISSLFSDRIFVLPSAFESARDSRAFLHRKKAFDLLWSLSTNYWSSFSRGESDATARRCFGASYAAKEAESLSKEGRKRRTFHFDGQDILMEKHLKIGVADNVADTLRVHFERVGDKGLIVIGHCGAHLDF